MLGGLAAARGASAAPPRQARPPNLLFIITDQQRYDTLACYRDTGLNMPNLNALARRSTVFQRHYVTHAVCTPSRSSIMTGRCSHNTGCVHNNIPLPGDMLCLPEMLPANTFKSGHFGKWHLGDEIFAQHGFDVWKATEDAYIPHYSPQRDRNARSAYHHWLISRGVSLPAGQDRFGRHDAANLPEALGKPAFIVNQVSAFIRDAAADGKPFVAFASFLEPHNPYHGPRDAQYEPAEIPLPPNFNHEFGPDDFFKWKRIQRRLRRKGFHGIPLKDQADWRQLISRYWGLCSLVDTHVGRILEALRESGQGDNTIIVFTSDHGDMMGSHRLITKNKPFDESARVPFILHLPGQRRQREIAVPTSSVDLAPTLVDCLGFADRLPEDLDGSSLRPVLAGNGEPADVVMEWNNWGKKDPRPRSIVSQNLWKLTYGANGAYELYDLSTDPFEMVNLVNEARNRPRMQKLVRRIRDWQIRTGDSTLLPELA